MDERSPAPAEVEWEQYVSRDRLRVVETSCCGAFEWVCQGGQYLVLRQAAGGGYEEAGRGRYADAREVWRELVAEHRQGHGTGPRRTLGSR